MMYDTACISCTELNSVVSVAASAWASILVITGRPPGENFKWLFTTIVSNEA